MKKIIRLFARISLFAAITLTFLALAAGTVYAIVQLNVYSGTDAYRSDISGAVLAIVLQTVLPTLLGLEITVVASVYLLKISEKKQSYIGEMILAIVYVGGSFPISSILSRLASSIINRAASSVPVMTCSFFGAAFQFVKSFDFSGTLILFALAFAIAEKVLTAKKDAEV